MTGTFRAFPYHFDYRSKSDHGLASMPDADGVCHTVKLPFIFGNNLHACSFTLAGRV